MTTEEIKSDDFKVFDLKDFFAGWIGGAAGIVVGQPFDTIKVRMATGENSSMFRTGMGMVKNEGVFSLFKGTLAPAMGYGACTAIAFGGFQCMNRFFCQRLGYAGKDDLPMKYLLISSFFGGVLSDIVCCPAELIKIQIQIRKGEKFTNGQAIKMIYEKAGIRGLYKGMGVTMLRDGPAFAGYFGCYEYLRRIWGTGALATLNAGGLGGMLSWAINYPFDLIKSKIQATPYKPEIGWDRYKGFMDCFKQVVREEGIKGLYKGFVPCALRGYPVNAVTFFGYEYCMKYFKELGKKREKKWQ